MTLKSVDVKSTGNQDRTIIILDGSNQIILKKPLIISIQVYTL